MTKDSSNISIFSLLKKDEDIKALCRIFKSVFSRLGVNTDFEISEKKIYDGSLLVTVTSTTFNTTPVIFHDVRIVCEGKLRKNEEKGTYELNMGCDYRYNLFTGGSNGCRIGTMNLTIWEIIPDCMCIAERFIFNDERVRIE